MDCFARAGPAPVLPSRQPRSAPAVPGLRGFHRTHGERSPPVLSATCHAFQVTLPTRSHSPLAAPPCPSPPLAISSLAQNDAAGDTPFSDILTFMLHEMHARDPGHATPSRTAALSTLLRLARRYPGMDATARADALGAIRTHLARVEEAEGRGEVATGHAGGSTWGREWRGERAVWESQGQRWSPSQGGADVAEGVTEAMASVKLDSARVDSARVEKTPSPSPSQRARQPLPASRVSHPDPHAHAPAARTASPPSRVSALSQEAEEERLRLQAQRNAEFGQRARVVVYDLETTGVSTARARIVEVAARVVALGASSLRWEEVPGATFHSLVNPGEPIPADATSEA